MASNFFSVVSNDFCRYMIDDVTYFIVYWYLIFSLKILLEFLMIMRLSFLNNSK